MSLIVEHQSFTVSNQTATRVWRCFEAIRNKNYNNHSKFTKATCVQNRQPDLAPIYVQTLELHLVA